MSQVMSRVVATIKFPMVCNCILYLARSFVQAWGVSWARARRGRALPALRACTIAPSGDDNFDKIKTEVQHPHGWETNARFFQIFVFKNDVVCGRVVVQEHCAQWRCLPGTKCVGYLTVSVLLSGFTAVSFWHQSVNTVVFPHSSLCALCMQTCATSTP